MLQSCMPNSSSCEAVRSLRSCIASISPLTCQTSLSVCSIYANLTRPLLLTNVSPQEFGVPTEYEPYTDEAGQRAYSSLQNSQRMQRVLVSLLTPSARVVWQS